MPIQQLATFILEEESPITTSIEDEGIPGDLGLMLLQVGEHFLEVIMGDALADNFSLPVEQV